jgi:hypothetical protein
MDNLRKIRLKRHNEENIKRRRVGKEKEVNERKVQYENKRKKIRIIEKEKRNSK